MANETSTKTIETPDGLIEVSCETVEPIPQQITLVGPEELARIHSWASGTTAFLAAYLGDVATPTLQDVDAAYLCWLREEERRFDEQDLVYILGAFMGDWFVSELNMEWVLVVDEYGTDYAVRSKEVEVMAFPFASIAKRIANHQYDFAVSIYETIRQGIASGDYKKR